MFVEVVIMAAMGVVASYLVKQEWAWFSANGDTDYLVIGLALGLFVLIVFIFDRVAEEQGWIVHHWWDWT
jgi:hypothetical protein